MEMRGFAALLGATISLALVQAASAADMPVKGPAYKAPPAVAAYNWTGCYVGGNVGGVWSRTDVEIPEYPANFDIDATSVAVGAHVGCNYMFPNRWVVGVEADWSWVDLEGDEPTTGLNGERYFVKWDWIATLRGRLGYGWDRTLIYVTGGGAWTHLERTNYLPTSCCAEKSGTFSGWTIGAGVEYALTPNWIVGAEYLFTSFDHKNFFYLGVTTVDLDEVHLVRGRVSYKW
jgi:outer membrane immunogenic protein